MKTAMEIVCESMQAAANVTAKGFIPTEYKLEEYSCDISDINQTEREVIFDTVYKLHHPAIFFFDLRWRAVGVFKALYPTLYAMIDCKHPNKWHPEGDVFMHTLAVLDDMMTRTTEPLAFAVALAHDIGKIKSENPPKHHGHESRGVYMVKDFLKEIGAKLDDMQVKIVEYTTRYHGHMHKVKSLKPSTLAKMALEGYNIAKSRYALRMLMLIAVADQRGRSFINMKAIDPWHFDENIVEFRHVISFMEQSDNKLNVQELTTAIKEGKHRA